MLSARREKPSLPSTQGPQSPGARHKAGSDSPAGAPAQSPGEKQEPRGRWRALAAVGLSHGRGPTRAAAGTPPRDSASPAAPRTARPPRRQVGWLHAGMLCAAAASPASITFASSLPWPLPRGKPCRDALAEPCRGWMRPLSSPWWQRHPQPGRSRAANQSLRTTQLRIHGRGKGIGDHGRRQGSGTTEEGRGLGTTAEGRGSRTMEEGRGLGTMEEGRGSGTTANSGGSHQPPSERRMEAPSHQRLGLMQTAYYNPTAWPVCLSLCLSNYLSRSLIKEGCSKKAGREGMSRLAVASFGKSGKTVAS